MFLKPRSITAALFWICIAAHASAQPGDGLPDLYYNSDGGLITIDSDGIDFIALTISPSMPDYFVPVFVPPDGEEWTWGLMNGTWEFISNNPLDGLVGVFDMLQGPTGIPLNDFPSPGGSMIDSLGTTWTLEFTKVPEPSAGLLGLFAIMVLTCLFRSPHKLSSR